MRDDRQLYRTPRAKNSTGSLPMLPRSCETLPALSGFRMAYDKPERGGEDLAGQEADLLQAFYEKPSRVTPALCPM